MRNTILKTKSKAMSVQSIIIGSVIAGVIAASGLAMLWPAVDAGKVTSELTTLSEINVQINSEFSSKGMGSTNNANSLIGIVDKLSLPNDFKYVVVTSQSTNGAFDGQSIGGIIAIAKDNEESQTKLKTIIKDLDKKFDGSDNRFAGKMGYETDCSLDRKCFYTLQLKQFNIQDPVMNLIGSVFNMRDASNVHVNNLILSANKGDTITLTNGGFFRNLIVLN